MQKSIKDEVSVCTVFVPESTAETGADKKSEFIFPPKFCQNLYDCINRAGFLNQAFPGGNLVQWKTSSRSC